jgi:radical SAM superfamily enzyme YgiQ (UPF0313 family)
MNYLRKQGLADVEFYNIDANRPSYREVLAHIQDRRPDILGISAVVSTAYAYVKQFAQDVKRLLPDTLIVVGGSLAASSEILLRRTGVDVCVLGEGEITLSKIVRAWETRRRLDALSSVPGVMFLDAQGNLINTGYEAPLDKTEIYDIEWRDLEANSPIDMFFPIVGDDDLDQKYFTFDPRTREPARAGRRMASLPGAKGCVARCTFCHRWEKGIRYIPVDLIMRRLEQVIARYNVGFVSIVDENFGTDRRWLAEFCAKIKRYDVLWRVGGMRVNCVSPEIIAMMKDAGCTSIVYGMETGSPQMLEIMEKKTSVADNRNAMRWTVEAGLWTAVQIIVGMPGESPNTIRDTVAFCREALTLHPSQNPNDLSINFAQALPGTPLYEYGRHAGLIGTTLDEEEGYLLRISDHDAHDEVTTLNFTNYPALICRTWRPRVSIDVNYHYVRKFGLEHYRRVLLQDANFFKKPRADSGYFANPKRLVDTSATSDTVHEVRQVYELRDATRLPSLTSLIRARKFGLALVCYPLLAYRVRHFLWLLVLVKALDNEGAKGAIGLVAEYLAFLGRQLVGTRPFAHGYKSLRKIVERDLGGIYGDHPAMEALRRGR